MLLCMYDLLPCLFKKIPSAMGQHIELKCEVVSHGFLEVCFCGNFIVEVIKRMKPFIVRFNGASDDE